MEHLAILVHEHDRFDGEHYLLRLLMDVWQARGIRVSIQQGCQTPVDADLAIVHVDVTKVPPEYLGAVAGCPRVLNRRVVDISKRAISTNRVSSGDGYDGPVIVKTNRNSGGAREQTLRGKGPRVRRYAGALREKLPWAFRTHLSALKYPIFESAKQVPLAAWYNPDLIIERFCPERRDGMYCLRTWTFLGDQETSSLSYSQQPIVKSQSVIRREPVTEVPAELRQIRKTLGFDYGKFDYGIVDDRLVLYDVNRTPTMGRLAPDQLPRFHNIHKIVTGDEAAEIPAVGKNT